MGLDIFHLQVGVFILHENNLGPIFNIGLCVVLVEKVISVFVVYLDEGDAEGVLILSCFGSELRENVGKHSWDYAPFFPFITSAHREGLATASLPISENGAIVAF